MIIDGTVFDTTDNYLIKFTRHISKEPDENIFISIIDSNNENVPVIRVQVSKEELKEILEIL